MVDETASMIDWNDALARRSREVDSGAIAAIMAQTESLNVITVSGGVSEPGYLSREDRHRSDVATPGK